MVFILSSVLNLFALTAMIYIRNLLSEHASEPHHMGYTGDILPAVSLCLTSQTADV